MVSVDVTHHVYLLTRHNTTSSSTPSLVLSLNRTSSPRLHLQPLRSSPCTVDRPQSSQPPASPHVSMTLKRSMYTVLILRWLSYLLFIVVLLTPKALTVNAHITAGLAALQHSPVLDRKKKTLCSSLCPWPCSPRAGRA